MCALSRACVVGRKPFVPTRPRFVPSLAPTVTLQWLGGAGIASLRANLDNPIEEVGDRATMSYGEGAAVLLVLEDGVWKVEDPD